MSDTTMRTANFLIIGAMKAGTTTLYQDLLTNPALFMPHEKEPETLTRDDVLTDRGRKYYARLFAPARDDQIVGEASTGYTKLPEFPDVPERALKVCGRELRCIYIVREPVARVISHHHHNFGNGVESADINAAVRASERFINWSKYAMQITPWIETFGRDHVEIVVFEEFIGNRRGAVAHLSRFLGVDPKPELVDPDRSFNRSDTKTVARGPLRPIISSKFYRERIKPLIPVGFKTKLRDSLLPKAPPRPDPPTRETVDRIIEGVRDDAERLRQILGREQPIWDFAAVRAKYEAPRAAAE